ncbi:hypothetical protein [Paenibacillus oceani]|uniref:Uncharacterized protein n=1 Tax=Paenibacillus oceani TaxID=2772510 RepID=A0A927C7V9_9BACL|nr:hypothetical protein [Paenibacillus oceani]MBD2862993.1 hypothetical protein [Paenibacillus oceani]
MDRLGGNRQYPAAAATAATSFAARTAFLPAVCVQPSLGTTRAARLRITKMFVPHVISSPLFGNVTTM